VAVRSAQAKGKRPQTGTVDTATWVAVEKLAYPLGARRW
jgi:hypothetical protein